MLKGGQANQVIEGLSQSADQDEAIGCLKKCYDRPRLIHREHTRANLDTPTLKEGNGKEVRRLHDIVTQHLRALAAMKKEKIESFITSMLELKLDQATMFEWQRHSQDSKDILPYSDCWNSLTSGCRLTKVPFKTQTSDDHVQLRKNIIYRNHHTLLA